MENIPGPVLRLKAFTLALNEELSHFREERRGRNIRDALDFSVFDHIRPGENRLSDILVELLRPTGTHGQGSLFLREFLAACGIFSGETLEGARLTREAITSHIEEARRIDFTVELPGLAVGIENKPWAEDQTDQLGDYVKHLAKKYGDAFYIVYLSGDGSGPTSLDASTRKKLGERFRLVSYFGELRAWLDSCKRQCQAEKVRLFLHDFLVYLDEQFPHGGGTTGGKKGPMARQNEENRVVADYALQDLPNLEAALACVKAFQGIAARIASAFTTRLHEKLLSEAGDGYTVKVNNDPDGGPDGERVVVTKDGWGSLRAVLAHDRTVPHDGKGPCKVYFQVRGDEEQAGKQPTEGLRQRLMSALNAGCGKGRSDSCWWPKWYQYAEPFASWDDPEVLLRLAKDERIVDHFASQLIKMTRVIENFWPEQERDS